MVCLLFFIYYCIYLLIDWLICLFVYLFIWLFVYYLFICCCFCCFCIFYFIYYKICILLVAPNISAGVRTPGPVPLGSTQVLTCTQLQGDPPDMVIWRTPSNNTLIPSGKDNRITVAFTTFSSYGNYACIASNRFGTSESIVVIREPGKSRFTNILMLIIANN